MLHKAAVGSLRTTVRTGPKQPLQAGRAAWVQDGVIHQEQPASSKAGTVGTLYGPTEGMKE